MKKPIIVLLHLGYWMMYVLLLLLFFLAIASPQKEFAQHRGEMLIGWTRFLSSFMIVPALFGFYSFYAFLFPRFLYKRKILLFFAIGILLTIVSGLLGAFFYSAVGSVSMFNDGWNSAIAETILMCIIGLISGIIGLVIRGFITSYGDITLKEDLNKKNYEMELALVKSQINPHFLFNTINNIDVLIEKDAAKASAYLNKLSDIMRFMLYETKTEQITLTKELTYIEKYIDLQKIRTSNSNYVNYVVEGHPGHLMIDPMLFIPFIENAFKHAENKKMENAINIWFVIEKNKITFDCENIYNENPNAINNHSGLGNELIQKRLTLLYPKKHTLEIINKDGSYKVKLILDLN